MAYSQGRWEGMKRTRGPRRTPGMSSPKHERDSDRESLTDWTLVDREGTPDKTTHEGPGKDDDKDSGKSSSSPAKEESKKEEKQDEEDKEKKGAASGEEEDAEELSEDLISMGKRVQEIKACSGSDSSDIETLECPSPDDGYEDSNQGYSSLHSSLLSSSISGGFTFVEEADEGDVESLASSDVMVLDQEGKAGVDEETDLSLASSPSLPDDLPAIKPDTQYRHTPDKDFNSRLNIVVALTLACVLGLGLGHFLGWSSRSLWQENLNSAQIVEALNLENEQLRTEITRLQHENVSPIKISGKDGKDARNLRERITHLLEDNEELRVAVLRQQFDSLPDGDTQAFSNALSTNHKLRLSVGKLTHLVPDLTTLKESANDLQKENQELQKQVGKLRYQEQPLPQELNVVAREVENLKKVVDEASKKKKPPANYENAKMYLAFMSQVLQTLHDFKEGGLVEKLDVATDVFEGLVPGNVKPSASVQQKLSAVRGKFKQLKTSLAAKWEKIKELSRPQHLSQVSQDTLGKMNRVVVNVVNKMKDIGQASIMKRGKASLESTAATLAQSLAALGDQFDKTWKNLEAQVDMEGKEATSDLLVGGEEEVVPAEEEVVDEGEGKAKERGSKEVKEASDTKNQAPNKAKKVDRKSGGSGGGGGRGGGRRGGGQDGDDKTEVEEKKPKEKVEKKDKPDGRKDRSRSRSGDEETKKEKKKKKEEKKKDSKEKSKKDKENKKIKEKEASGRKKEDKESRKSPEREDKRYHKGQYNKYDKKQQQRVDDDNDDDSVDESNNEPKPSRKFHKKKVYEDDDEDEDDSYKRKHQTKPEKDDDDDEEKKKGLLRHWEKPSRKNYRREYPGPKKAFIRRRDQ